MQWTRKTRPNNPTGHTSQSRTGGARARTPPPPPHSQQASRKQDVEVQYGTLANVGSFWSKDSWTVKEFRLSSHVSACRIPAAQVGRVCSRTLAALPTTSWLSDEVRCAILPSTRCASSCESERTREVVGLGARPHELARPVPSSPLPPSAPAPPLGGAGEAVIRLRASTRCCEAARSVLDCCSSALSRAASACASLS